MILKLKKSDFLMAKRLKRRLARENKDRAGCMSGIISVFDFRHGRITRRLLSDHQTYMTESTTGPSCPTSEGPSCPTSDVNSLIDSEEMHQRNESPNNEKNETTQRVKELMEEEMQCDEIGDLKDQIDSEILIDNQVPSQKTPQYRDLEEFVNGLLRIHEKRNEEQNPKSLERSNSLNHERTNPRSEQPVTRKNRNFFRRRSKSHECISLNDTDTPLPSNTTTNGFHHERSLSNFSFTEIKKKLKNAIGRSSRDLGCLEKPIVDGNSGWSSPNREHFYSERFSRITNGFLRQETRHGENKSFGDTSDRISNIYVEAKKHLSDMLNNGDDEDTELVAGRYSRTLGKLLSFPNYNSFSSGIGSRNETVVKESQPCMADKEQQEPEVSDEVHQAKDVVEIVKPPSPEEIKVVDAPELTEEDELSCSPIPSPSGSPIAINQKIKEAESTSDDRTDKPSPVSVLEPLFSDDDISPARIISRTAESSLQPLRIRFEETVTSTKYQETSTINHVESEESEFEYIEVVLLASDLNWDEFEQRWLSSVQILDPSLYHELQIFSNRPSHDQLLLFDATNEILKEVCDHCLGLFPELSYCKPHIHRLPKGMNFINEVWERIESRLNCYYPRSLDQLIKKDFEVSRTWTDHCSETQEIVTEMEELICDDMIDDTVFSLMHDELAMS